MKYMAVDDWHSVKSRYRTRLTETRPFGELMSARSAVRSEVKMMAKPGAMGQSIGQGERALAARLIGVGAERG